MRGRRPHTKRRVGPLARRIVLQPFPVKAEISPRHRRSTRNQRFAHDSSTQRELNFRSECGIRSSAQIVSVSASCRTSRDDTTERAIPSDRGTRSGCCDRTAGVSQLTEEAVLELVALSLGLLGRADLLGPGIRLRAARELGRRCPERSACSLREAQLVRPTDDSSLPERQSPPCHCLRAALHASSDAAGVNCDKTHPVKQDLLKELTCSPETRARSVDPETQQGK